MDDPIFTELRKLVGQHEKIVYEAVKADTVAQLPHESQLFAKAMQEHMHLKHIHNALEFADLREGEPYEITVGGEPVNPLAHLTAHAAVKGQLEQDPLVRAAFEKMLATGTAAHHAEHVLGALLFETEWETACAVEAGKDTERLRAFTSANFKDSSGIRPSAKNSRGSFIRDSVDKAWRKVSFDLTARKIIRVMEGRPPIELRSVKSTFLASLAWA